METNTDNLKPLQLLIPDNLFEDQFLNSIFLCYPNFLKQVLLNGSLLTFLSSHFIEIQWKIQMLNKSRQWQSQ